MIYFVVRVTENLRTCRRMTRELHCMDRSRALARTVSNLLQPKDVKVTENYFVDETFQLILKEKFEAYKRQTI